MIIKNDWAEDPWEWDKTGKIVVYGLSGVSNKDIKKVIKNINEVIIEFSLPLLVKIDDTNKKDELEQIVKNCSNKNEIDFYKLEEELNRRRKLSEFLPWGIVVVVNTEYSFKKYPHDKPAIYGMGNYTGLMVIKSEFVHINRITKHEFGQHDRVRSP